MIFDPILDLFRGKAVTIPPMDGALRPNTALDDAEVVCEAAAPDNLVEFEGSLLFSSGSEIRALAGGRVQKNYDHPIAAMAAQDAVLAAGLESGQVDVGGTALDGFNCPVALAFGGKDELFVCNGSDAYSPANWTSDLMSKNAKGSVWRIDLKTGSRKCLASGLAFPHGVAVDSANRRLVVTESWRHRVVGIPLQGGAPTELLAKLPGYPARISPSPGGYVLSLFAPRNRLIEFVLLEDGYRADMMRETDPRHWIAPSLSPSRSFLEPLQNGAVRSMGIHKPWSPSRSYGLVVEIDSNLHPVASFHSRANGLRHGITSVAAHGGSIIATSKGGNAILRVVAEGTR